MANNYLSFSEEIGLTPKQAAWAKKWLELCSELLELPDDPNKVQNLEALPEMIREYGFLGFNYNFDAKGALWIYSEESGVPDHVAEFYEALLTEFPELGVLTLEWAATCSKPRVGEFGGGALIVYSTGINWSVRQCAARARDTRPVRTEWVNTGDWLREQRAAWAKAAKKAKAKKPAKKPAKKKAK